MSTAHAGTGQRKRKLDPPADVGNKRKRSNETPSKATENHAFTISGILRATQGKSSTIDRSDSLNPERGSSNAELSSDTETSSDSETSSTESESEDESEDLERNSRNNDTDSDRGSLGYGSAMISLPTQSRPSISSPAAVTGLSGLRSRIASFLPQLRKANEELVTAGDDRRIDVVAEDQDQYIEMDLGLGVLKEKKKLRPLNGEIQTHEISSSSSSSSSDDDESEAGGPEKDAMLRLMARKEARSSKGRPMIQDIDET
jgi:hypothetical protein